MQIKKECLPASITSNRTKTRIEHEHSKTIMRSDEGLHEGF